MDKKKRIALSITAHVDAGKTTLAEAILYEAGQLKKRGRVDHRDSALDFEDFERSRGITAFSKQAVFSWDKEVFEKEELKFSDDESNSSDSKKKEKKSQNETNRKKIKQRKR